MLSQRQGIQGVDVAHPAAGFLLGAVHVGRENTSAKHRALLDEACSQLVEPPFPLNFIFTHADPHSFQQDIIYTPLQDRAQIKKYN
jgi:hypothetical protein